MHNICVFNNFWILIFIAIVVEAELFAPNLKTRCINGFMSITVQCESPFHGVVYTRGKRDSCYATGTGNPVTTLNIPLTAEDRCGVQYDQAKEQYYVLLEVRQHPMIILQQDRSFNVSCPKKETTDNTTGDSDPIEMGLVDPTGFKVHQTVLGDNYTLRIASKTSDFNVHSCMGFAGYNYSLELIDSSGCSINVDIMSNFNYNRQLRSATSAIHSMFKFPQHNLLHIQCSVVYCLTGCRNIDCERRRDEPLNLELKSEQLSQERFASTTVSVSEVGNRTDFYSLAVCGYHYSVLTALCILFGILLLLAVVANVVFCVLSGVSPCGSDKNSESVEYVIADAKGLDAVNSTISRKHQLANHWYPGYYTNTPASHSPRSYKSGLSHDSERFLISNRKSMPVSLPTPDYNKF